MAYTRMNLVRPVAIGFMTDTMGRMHSDAQFAGRHSASVTTLWLLVRLTLLLRSISKRLPVKPVMTLSHARLDRASHYQKFTETSFGCLCFFCWGRGRNLFLSQKKGCPPKTLIHGTSPPGKRGKTDILGCFGHRCTNNQPKFVSSIMSGHPMNDMFQMARGVVLNICLRFAD